MSLQDNEMVPTYQYLRQDSQVQQRPLDPAQILFPRKSAASSQNRQSGILHQLLSQGRAQNQQPRILNNNQQQQNRNDYQGQQGRSMTAAELAHQIVAIPDARQQATRVTRNQPYSKKGTRAPTQRPAPINIRAPATRIPPVQQVHGSFPTPPETPPETPKYSDPSIVESNEEYFVKQIGQFQIKVIRAKDKSNAVYPMHFPLEFPFSQ